MTAHASETPIGLLGWWGSGEQENISELLVRIRSAHYLVGKLFLQVSELQRCFLKIEV